MNKRNGMIDFLKFVFIVVIFIFHGSKNLTSKTLFQNASILVEFFFLVSGYLMANHAMKQSVETGNEGFNTVSYLIGRIRRFFPNYYIAWIIAFVSAEVIGKVKLKKVMMNLLMSIPELTFISSTGILGTRFNAATWYLSAMLVAMLLLYPLSVRLKGTFNSVIAPVISLFIYAYMYQNFKHGVSSPAAWTGFMTKGLLRAFAGLSLGCFCYHIATMIKKNGSLSFSKRVFWSFIEIVIYGFILYCSKGYENHQIDFILIIIMAFGVTISFSDITISPAIMNNKLVYWLGEFSFNLYISHGFWSHQLSTFVKGFSFSKTMLVYSCVSLGTALFVMYISKLFNHMLQKKKSIA